MMMPYKTKRGALVSEIVMMKSTLVVIVCACFLGSLVLRVSIAHKVTHEEFGVISLR
jgi:hypothetical protein